MLHIWMYMNIYIIHIHVYKLCICLNQNTTFILNFYSFIIFMGLSSSLPFLFIFLQFSLPKERMLSETLFCDLS